jgi:hypothetical protein
MDTVRSADGTPIAFDRSGVGPALVLVVGAFCDRSSTKTLASGLSTTFSVYEYDRRGRGDSGEIVAGAVPNARSQVLEGQGHGVADDVIIPVLTEFFV